jgi:hypothetical protein
MLRDIVLLAEPAERSPDVGLVVCQGLGADPDTGVMQLTDSDLDRGPAGGNDRGRAVEPFGELTQ